MRRSIRWVLGAVLLVVLAAVGVGAWYVFGDRAPGKPTLQATATTDASAASSTPDGSWVVAPRADDFVGYRIQEQFAGDVVHHAAVGRTRTVRGTAQIAGGKVTGIAVTVEVATLESDRATRDRYIHTHSLESDTYPTARFEIAAPVDLPSPVRAGERVHVSVSGRLTLHGVTKPVTVGLDARWNGATIDVAGSAPIRLADFGIDPPHTPLVSVDDHGSFELQLTLRRA